MSVMEMERGLSPLIAPEAEFADRPEMGPGGMVFEIMGEASVIEKDQSPKPIATIETGDAASTQAVVAVLAELSDRMNGDPESGERFRPVTLADLQEAIEDIKAGDRRVTDTSAIEALSEPGALVRPSIALPERSGGSSTDRRHSRLRTAVATAAFAAVGMLAWASSASAKGLKDTCAPSIFDKGTVLESEMHNPGKHYQSITIKIHVNEVDPQCDGAFKRVVSVKPQIKHKGSRRWLNEDFYTPIYIGDTSPAEDIGGIWFNSHGIEDLYYRRGDRVRFLEKIDEKNEATGKIVKTKVSPHRVFVIGG